MALSRNILKITDGAEILLANCLAHGRRQFVEVAANFPPSVPTGSAEQENVSEEDCQLGAGERLLNQTYLAEHNARYAVAPSHAVDFHEPVPAQLDREDKSAR